jgi:hypothetical protein
MTTQPQTSTATPSAKGRRPTNRLWFVQGEDENATWTEITGLWPTRGNTGLYATLAEMPACLKGGSGGRLVVLPAKFKPASTADVGAQ